MIQPVSALTPKASHKGFSSSVAKPIIDSGLERKLAFANAGGISAVMGGVTTAIARSYTASWKHASWFGILAAGVTMLFAYPKFIYEANNARKLNG